MSLRYGIRSSVTWRIVAELIRRHGTPVACAFWRCTLGAQYDCLSLVYGPTDQPFLVHMCDFNVQSQHLHVFSPYGLPRLRADEAGGAGAADYVLRFVTAEDPREAVDRVEALLGLPATDKNTPPATPTSVALRVIASTTEKAALDRGPLEARCAWYDSSGAGGWRVQDWVLQLPRLAEKLAGLSPGADWQDVTKIVGRMAP